MKKLLLLLTAGVLAMSVHAQGTIKVENNNTIRTDGSGTYRIPFWVDLNNDGVQQTAAGEIGIGQWADQRGWGPTHLGLFTVGSNTAFGVGTFRTDQNGAFLAPPTSQTVVVPGHAAGTRPTLVVKVWFAGSSDPANPGKVLVGERFFQVSRPLGGFDPVSGTEITPSGLAGLGDEVTSAGLGSLSYSWSDPPIVPEPATIALVAIGLAAIALRDRKKSVA